MGLSWLAEKAQMRYFRESNKAAGCLCFQYGHDSKLDLSLQQDIRRTLYDNQIYRQRTWQHPAQ